MWFYLAPAWDLVMRIDMFLNSSTKFQILSWFSLSNSKFNWCKSQAGPFNHIHFVSLFSRQIHYSLAEEQLLFDRYLFALAMGEWGVYDSLSPTQKLVVFLRRLTWVACGWVMVFWCGLLWPWWWWWHAV